MVSQNLKKVLQNVREDLPLSSQHNKMNKTSIMGILNITPDSFYDGTKNLFDDSNKLNEKIKEFRYADIIDVGCEASRPGSLPINIEEELNRIKLLKKIKFDEAFLQSFF